MGAFMLDCDNQIPGLLDALNLRFGPSAGDGDDRFNGIEEMAALQNEFKIFQAGRPFSKSVNVLGLAGFGSARAKNRWLRLLDALGTEGDKIVEKIIHNLASSPPKPMYFTGYRSDGGKNVQISDATPIVYSNTSYVVIALPMKPKSS